VAIGNPFGLERTLTAGGHQCPERHYCATGRVIESRPGDGAQSESEAAINPGNSGGPLLDLQGRVIGVNSQIVSPVRGSAGIGFAVSSNTVRRVVPRSIAHGRYPHPWLGVSILPFDAQGAQILREAGMHVPVDAALLRHRRGCWS
jgi:S1-C subfamily serine protease